MHNLSRSFAAFGVTLALALAAVAGPLEDARTSYKKHDYQSALALLEKAQQQDPNNPLIYAAMGNTYRHLDDTADAKKAYDRLLELDPDLNSIKDKSAFKTAYEAVGGISAGASSSSDTGSNTSLPVASGPTATDIVAALTSGDVYVVPGMQDKVDSATLSAAAEKARPTTVKIAVLAHTGNYPNRTSLADDLRKHLNLPDDAIVLVGMPNGISGSSDKLASAQIDAVLQKAGLDQSFAQSGLTGALVRATEALSGGVVNVRRTSTERIIMLPILVIAIILVVIFVTAGKKKREIGAARQSLESLRRNVLDNLSYVDGYLDLLPTGEEADRAKKLRAGAYESYATANGVFQTARSADEVRRAAPLLEQAMSMLGQCRAAIDKATGGTGVAMSVPEMPSLMTDAQKGRAFLNDPATLRPVEQVSSASERDRYQREIESIPPGERGVSFFSGRPMPASQLVPVTMVVGGKKRTVMATLDEADAISRGQTPPVRAFADASGRYTPWYEYRGYDPYRDYYGGWGGGMGVVGDMVDLYLLTSLLGPGLYGGYGPWGYDGYGYGMPLPPMFGMDTPGFYGPMYDGPSYVGDNGGGGGYDNGIGYDNSGGYDDNGAGVGATPDNAGGFDFAGQQDYNNQDPSGGFDVAPGDPGLDAGSNDGGGFDFGGGGDSGGFDFGGGDSGGGFDFGGGDGS